ncbi:hypothetical protein [Pseudactinotalea suaedae]|uniref:hypothetical protein n=1 Tax=Pseudactinotalea suaedae TaxID=1524924 RepID=UPI001F504137|nr:hypothetical protein [Pseudactinotalea suaedae]
MDLVTGGGYAAMAACGLLALWAGIWALRDRAVILKQLIAGGVVLVLLLVQAVGAIIELAGGRELAEPPVFWGYVIVAVLLLPAAAVVAIAERTRWSSVTLVVIALAVLVMELRILQLWSMGQGAA